MASYNLLGISKVEYLFTIFFIAFAISLVRVAYTKVRFDHYAQEYYRKKTGRYVGPYSIKLQRQFWGEHSDVEDEQFVLLKQKARKAIDHLFIVFLLGFVFFFILLIFH